MLKAANYQSRQRGGKMNLGDRFAAKLQTRLNQEVGHRGDLFLADFTPIDASTAHVLIGYDALVGTPSRNEVIGYIINAFSGELSGDINTARNHAEGAVSLILKKASRTRPYADAQKMYKVSASVFMDQQVKDSWEVKERGGNKVLVRMSPEDITGILEARRARMKVGAFINFDRIGEGTLNYSAGDTVRFYKDEKEQTGIVVAKTAVATTIRVGDESVRVEPSRVFDVLQVNAMEDEEQKRRMYDYYEKVYGPDYARKMVYPEQSA